MIAMPKSLKPSFVARSFGFFQSFAFSSKLHCLSTAMYSSKIVQLSIFSLFAATPLRAATVLAVPYTDCSIESGRPCGGMVYSPATWCQNNLAEAIYSTVAGASGSAACRFTASPTKITLGIQSTYHVADVPSCASSAHAPYTTAAWNITAASNTTAISTFTTASAASTTAALSLSSLNTQPTSSTAATTTAVAPAAPIHTANCTMVFRTYIFELILRLQP